MCYVGGGGRRGGMDRGGRGGGRGGGGFGGNVIKYLILVNHNKYLKHGM